ncbi:replicative DNA helicase [Thiospirillum jenense]
MPPNNLNAEQSLLGALMLSNQTWELIADKVSEQDFYHYKHRLIFRAIQLLADENQPCDIITLAEALEKHKLLNESGGLPYLAEIESNTATAANAIYYAHIIRFNSVLRQLIRVGTEITDLAFDTQGRSEAEILDHAESKVFQIAEQLRRGGGFISIKQLVTQASQRIDDLYHQEGALTGLPTGFTDLDEKTSGLQNSELIIVAGRPSMGKCFGKGTPILMYSGDVKAVENIQVGDLLMGNDSTPRRVLSLARGQEKMYWIRQNKGLDYRVNESHILALKRRRNTGSHQTGDMLNIALTDYLHSAPKFRSHYKGYKVAIEFAEQPLPIAPYFFGLWLGDGSSSSVSIATTAQEIVDYLREYAIASAEYLLSELGVLHNKHIPQLFLANSKQHRVQLLAGLIDSAGDYLPQCNTYEITQKNAHLAKQIKWLCDSLGFRTSLVAKQATIQSIDDRTTVYRVRFSGNLDTIPVKIPRKQATAWTSHRTWQQTGITVEYDKVDNYYGFVCDGNRLFLLEDMTVVHNTSFAMNMAEHVAINTNKTVAVFSMEMSGESLAMRLLSSVGRIDQQRVRSGRLMDEDWPRLTTAMATLSNAPLYIDDTGALSPTELRARVRRLQRDLTRENKELGMIVVDYIQLMQTSTHNENRATEISLISRSMKALAKELQVPVVALSQLNRSLENRPSKRPVMSDLRESGAIEQDADLIIFIYRDEVYNPESPDKGTAEIIIGKQRNGPIGTVKLAFLGQYTRFENLATEAYGGERGY